MNEDHFCFQKKRQLFLNVGQMCSLNMLLVLFWSIDVFAINELLANNTFVCRKFNESQKSLEIDCGHSDDCFSMDQWPVAQVLYLKIKECPLKFVQNLMATNLTTIDISSSGYESLDAPFPFVQKLEKMNASHNAFTQIPANFLHHAPTIIELDFSYNRLERIESMAFIGVPKLQRIHLTKNQMSMIADEAFTNLTQLQYVNLNGNRCHWIDMF